MHILQLSLQNFKRFTDLIIDLSKLAQAPKLVLLIGANGSGKSSIFDAFELRTGVSKDERIRLTPIDYYQKQNSLNQRSGEDVGDIKITIETSNGIYANYETAENLSKNAFYGRSSLRQVPRLLKTSTQSFDLASDADRPHYYIDRDNRFENDIEILTQQILNEVFDGDDFDAKKLKEKYLQPINESLYRIFGYLPAPALELVSLKPPFRGNIADIRFKKGVSEIHYNLLSSGVTI